MNLYNHLIHALIYFLLIYRRNFVESRYNGPSDDNDKSSDASSDPSSSDLLSKESDDKVENGVITEPNFNESTTPSETAAALNSGDDTLTTIAQHTYQPTSESEENNSTSLSNEIHDITDTSDQSASGAEAFESSPKKQSTSDFTLDLWSDINGSSYTSSISYKDDKIIIYFNGTYITFERGTNGLWTGRKVDIELFANTSDDPTTNVGLGDSHYELRENGDELNYGFKGSLHLDGTSNSTSTSDPTYTEIRCQNEYVWKLGDHGMQRPLSLNYNKKDGHISIRDDKNVLFYRRGDDGSWKFYVGYPTDTGGIKLYSQNHDGSTSEMDSNSYQLTRDPRKTYILGYNLNGRCTEVKQEVTIPDPNDPTKVITTILTVWESGLSELDISNTDDANVDATDSSQVLSDSSTQDSDPYTQLGDISHFNQGSSEIISPEVTPYAKTSKEDNLDEDIFSTFDTSSFTIGLKFDPSSEASSSEYQPKFTNSAQLGDCEPEHFPEPQPPISTASGNQSEICSLYPTDHSSGSDTYVPQHNNLSKYKWPKLPKKLIFNTKDNLMWVIFDDSYVSYMYMTDKWVNSSDLDIKFFSKDPNDSNKTVELDSTKYDKKNTNATRIDYQLKSDVQCTLIKINDKELWKHGDHDCNENLKSVSYRNEITIVLDVGDAFIRYDKDNEGNWYYEHTNKLKTTGHQSGGGGSTDTGQSIKTDGSSSKLSETDGSSTTPPSTTPKTSGSQGTGQAKPSTSKTGVDLNITSQEATNDFDYKKDGEYVTYTAKDNYAIKLVKDHKTEIWKETNASNYSDKVEVDIIASDSKAVTIHLPGNNTKVFVKESGVDSFTEIDTTNVNPKSINITDTKETYIYSNKFDNDVRTFTAKKGFVFNQARYLVNNDWVDIWTTSNENEYANKVVNEGGKKLTIYIGENTNPSKLFMRDGENDSWDDIDLKNSNPRSVNITDTKETYFYSNKLDNDVRTFEARDKFAFNSVKDGSTDIWTTTDESEYAKKVVNEGGKKITIYIGEGTIKVFNKGSDDKWSEDAGTSPKTGVDLNIKSDKKSNKKLEYEKVGEYATYTAKDNYAFKLVKEDGTNIWEATNATEYSIKVEVDLMVESKVVTIFLSENKTKVFKKDVDNNCWITIDTSKVNAKSININYPYETYFYKHELNGYYRTFTAKTGFAIKGAHEYVNRSKVEVWKTDNESEYVNKIEVDLMNNDAKAVTVYMAGNKTRVFKKDGMSEPWKEIDTNNVNPKPVNINYPYECYFYQNKLQDNFRTFTAKKGFAFKNVIEYINNIKIEIWKTDQDSEYVNKIDIDLMDYDSKALTIYFADDKTKLFSKDDKNDPWNEIDTTKVNPRSINIKYERESYFCTNRIDNNGVRTVEAKTGFAFKCAYEYIDHTRVEIWKTDNQNEYATKVEYAKRFSGYLDLTINLVSGKNKLFIKGSDNDPWKEIDITKVNPGSLNINYHHETYFCKNELDNNVRTFTSKKGFAFKGVIESVDSKVEIWKTDNESEYAKKVVAEGGNKVTIHLANGSAKAFKKGSDGNWKEDTSGQGTGTTGHTPPKTTGQGGSQAPKSGSQQPSSGQTVSTGTAGQAASTQPPKTGTQLAGTPTVTTGQGVSTQPPKTGTQPSSSPPVRTGQSGGGSTTIGQTGVTQGASSPPKNTGQGSTSPPAIPAGPRSQGSDSTSGGMPAIRTASAHGTGTPPAVPAGPAGRSAGTPNVTTVQGGSTATSGQPSTGTAARTGSQQSSIPTAKTDSQPSTGTPARTGQSGTQPPNGGTQQQSSTSADKTGSQQQSSTQHPKSGSQPSSSPPARTGQSGTQGATPIQTQSSSGPTRTSGSAQSQSGTSVTSPKPQARGSPTSQPSGTSVTAPKAQDQGSPTSQPSGTSVTAPKPKDQGSPTSQAGTQQSPSSQRQTQATATDNSQTAQKTAPDSKQSAETKTAAQPGAKSQPTSGASSGTAVTTPVNQSSAVAGQPGGRTSGSSSATPPTTGKTGGTQEASGTAAKTGAQQASIATPPSTTGQTAGTQQQSSSPAARTSQSGGYQQSSTPPVRTGQSGTQPPKGGTQQQSSGQGAGAITTGQSSSQPSSQTAEQKPKSSPTSQSQSKSPPASQSQSKESPTSQSQSKESPTTKTGTQPEPASPASSKESADNQSSQAGQQSKKAGEGRGAGSQATTPPASPTSGAEDKAKKSTETSKRTGIEVCIKNNKKATDQFDYKIDEQYVTYSAKGNNAFKTVMDCTTKVWEATTDEYSSKVEVDLMNYDSKAVTVYLPENKTKLFKKDGSDKPWNEIDTTKVNPKKVNIGFPYETYIWKHDSHDNCRTFTARKGFAFNVVSESAQGSTVEIWKTDKANEYANKIELVDKKMTIHIGEGTSASTKVFEKGTDGKWTKQTSGQGTGTTGHTS
ncbi:hypothetical protein MACJ_002495 [Theileria orientalis]|uniref:SfiI-subtelomeric related protein family member n=1 Tax=Theileria orientalis TaxID=68886 RepID=A0A976QSQ8_THEOR|nr:hypothetical protein MACJ_002495 [Theileria orientalis]